ncbi:hypothetical protein SAMN05421593_2103 [Chryseobacterium culicis]|uniref:SnoaL-like domain-containing protein n=2 Tax=Chryseobacterium culicis TaxID=680127 RepID=A0A1H6HFM9_CHRCI|nr:hypothetical protein SAMN05421593_2103 [Chryseobacterium culicis]
MKHLNIQQNLERKCVSLAVFIGLTMIPFTSYAQHKTETMETKTIFTTLIKKHFEILNTKDSKDRIGLMEKTYNSDFRIIESNFENSGITEFNNAIEQFHQKMPGKKFIMAEDTVFLNSAAKALWTLGNSVTGEDVFLFRDGKISTIVVFVKPVQEIKSK